MNPQQICIDALIGAGMDANEAAKICSRVPTEVGSPITHN